MARKASKKPGKFQLQPWHFGRVEDQALVAREVDKVLRQLRHPVFMTAAHSIKDTGAGKVVMLTAFLEKQCGGQFPLHNQTIGDCFAAGTMVLGERTRAIEHVRVGDVVWTGEGRLTRVVSVRAIETCRPMVRIHSVGGRPTTCTADHKFLVYRMGRVAGKRVNSTYYRRAIGGQPQGFAKGKVITIFESRRPEWVAASDLRDTDCLLAPTALERIPAPHDVPGGLWDSAAGRRLLGYFLGNGYAGDGSVEFAVSNPSIESELVTTLVAAGFSPKVSSYRKDCGAWRVRVHNRKLVDWFRLHFYDDEAVKSFPGWAIGCADFLAGLAAADGHGSGNHHSVDSTSDSIIFATVASLVQLGYEPTVNPASRSIGTYPNARPLWRVTWRDEKQKSYVWRDEQFVCRPIRRIEWLEGPVVVYDVGVADAHHSFLPDGHAAHNCVSHGWGLGTDVVKATQIATGAAETFTGETATELIYAGSRHEIGHDQIKPDRQNPDGDGSVGAWAAQFVTEYGTLIRGKYGNLDLTNYDGQLARQLGRTGVPDDLEPRLREHPIKTTSLVLTYEQARDSIANGYPVAVSSMQGFRVGSQGAVRDKDGFLQPEGQWGHCQLFAGADDKFGRPGLLCVNSWGTSWISGPTRNGQPEGSYWVDAGTVNRMLAEHDSFALSGYVGYPGQVDQLEYMLI
jgi:hypothetical protein